MKKIFVGILTFFLMIVLCAFSLASVAQDLAIKSMAKYAILPGLQGHIRNIFASANPYATPEDINALVAEIENSGSFMANLNTERGICETATR